MPRWNRLIETCPQHFVPTLPTWSLLGEPWKHLVYFVSRGYIIQLLCYTVLNLSRRLLFLSRIRLSDVLGRKLFDVCGFVRVCELSSWELVYRWFHALPHL